MPQARPRQSQLLLLLLRRRLHRPLRRPGAVRRRCSPATCRWRAAGGSTPPAPACRCGWSSRACSASGARGDARRGRPGAAPGLRRAPRRVPVAGRRRDAALHGRPRGYGVRRVRSAAATLDADAADQPLPRAGVRRSGSTTWPPRRRRRHRPDRGDRLMTVTARRRARGSTPRCRSESRVDALLAEMTLAEKVGQTHQVANLDPRPTPTTLRGGPHRLRASTPPAPPPATSATRASLAGTIDASQRHGRRGAAGSASRVLFGRDVIHGHRTVVPDPARARRVVRPRPGRDVAAIAAAEAAVDGVAWTFAPMVDLSEEPRWGRVAESLGEAPVLAGRLAAASVAGFQGGPGRPTGSPRAPSTSSATAWPPAAATTTPCPSARTPCATCTCGPSGTPSTAGVLDGDGGLQRRRRHPDARPPRTCSATSSRASGASTASSSPTGTASASSSTRASPATCARRPAWPSRPASTSTWCSGALPRAPRRPGRVRRGRARPRRRRGPPRAAGQVPPRSLRAPVAAARRT